MSTDKRKTYQLLGLVGFVVTLCIGAGYLHYAYGECAKMRKEWHGIYCAD